MRKGYLSAKALINFSYRAEGKSVLDRVGNNKNYSDGDYPVNSLMKETLLWNRIFDLNIKRVHENNIHSMAPWSENVQVILKYDERIIYNNQTFLEYFDIEFSNYKYCYTNESKNSSANGAVGSAVYFSH